MDKYKDVGHRCTNDDAQKVVNTTIPVVLLHSLLVMDPNAEDRPPTAQIAEVDVDISTEVCRVRLSKFERLTIQARAVPPAGNPPLEPLLASSIFRQAFDDGRSSRENTSRSAGIATQARKCMPKASSSKLIM